MVFVRTNPSQAKRGQLIAQIWRGWAPQATADDYQRHYESEVSSYLQAVDGFRGRACCAKTTAKRRCSSQSRSSPALMLSVALPARTMSRPSSKKLPVGR